MILVTGGTGLVGSHLLWNLSQKEEKIRAIYRTEHSLEKVRNVFQSYSDDFEKSFSKIEWVQADITRVPDMIPAFKNVTHVYHCAALISFQQKDYREMRKVNIHGTAIIANLSIDAGVKKLCFVSSIAALSENPGKEFIDEENEWNEEDSNHGYAITKYGAEMEVWRASQEGVDVIIVNPGVILGSGFWNSGSGKLFSQVYNGFKFHTEGSTGFVSVNDVVKSMILLMNSDVQNERFILVSENKTYKEVLFSIADALKVKRPSTKIKPWQSNIFWRIEKFLSWFGKAPKITKQTAASLHSKSLYSSQKLIDELEFQFEDIESVIPSVSLLFLKSKNR